MARKRKLKYDVGKLAKARDMRGLTNVEIAGAIDVHQSTVARTLSGHPQHQSPKTVYKIASFLDVPMEEITHPLPSRRRS